MPAESLPQYQQIADPIFRRAVDLVGEGDSDALRAHLAAHPDLIHQRVEFAEGGYFRNPALLEFVAENPVRRGSLPANIVEVAKVILETGAKNDRESVNAALALVCSGRIAREWGAQVSLINLLCDYGADPNVAMDPALAHGEFEAVEALLRRKARFHLPAAAALGRIEDTRRLLPIATAEERHRALALAAQFGHTDVVRLLLDAGEDPNGYNPPGTHAHSTPLHQAAFAGHYDTVKLLVERGARLDIKDRTWQGTPEGWARHAGKSEVAEYLRARGASIGS